MSRDMQKYLLDLCMSQIVTILLAREIQIAKFFVTTKFPFVQSRSILPIDGVTLNNFALVVFIFDRNACANELVVFGFGKERLYLVV